MKVLNIYYKEDTGEIRGYQFGGTLTPRNEIPDGCKRIAFSSEVNIWDAKTHRTIYKVDVNTKQLVLITTPPVEEKDLLSDLEKKLISAQEDLKVSTMEEDIEHIKYLKEYIESAQLKIDRLKAEQSHVSTYVA